MPCNSAFPVPPPLPGTKKAFPEVHDRALPSSVRKFLGKPASRPALALSVKPNATKAHPTSRIAVKPPHHDQQQASALLRKLDEVKVFVSKIPVRIIASTTDRPGYQDNAIRKRDNGLQHSVATTSLDNSISKAFRARSSPPKKPSFVPVCGKGQEAVITRQIQPKVSHFQAAAFIYRIPVRKLIGRAESRNIQRTMHSIILPPQSSTVPATVKTNLMFIPEVTVIPEEGWREVMPLGDFLVAVQQEPCSEDKLPGQEKSNVLSCVKEQREDASDVHPVPLQTEQSVDEATDAPPVQSQDGESMISIVPQLKSAAVPLLTRKQKRSISLRERRKGKKRATKLLVNEASLLPKLFDAIPADHQKSVPSVLQSESHDYEETSIESQSVDNERIDLHMQKSQEKAKPQKQGHQLFFLNVFVLDWPPLLLPTCEVKEQPDDERLHVSTNFHCIIQ